MTNPTRRSGPYAKKRLKIPRGQSGQYRMGINNEKILIRLGNVVTEWAILEHSMSLLLGQLLGHDGNAISTQVFYAIINQKTRADLMGALLAESSVNARKTPLFETVLEKCRSLTLQRNNYIHARYETRRDNNLCYISELKPIEIIFSKRRRITIKELDIFINDIRRFYNLALDLWLYDTKPDEFKKIIPKRFAELSDASSGKKSFQQLWDESKSDSRLANIQTTLGPPPRSSRA